MNVFIQLHIWYKGSQLVYRVCYLTRGCVMQPNTWKEVYTLHVVIVNVQTPVLRQPNALIKYKQKYINVKLCNVMLGNWAKLFM